MSDIFEFWTYYPLEEGFCSISQKLYRAVILVWVGQETSKFYLIFILIVAFKKFDCGVNCYSQLPLSGTL